jgi:hypothetical protein
MSNIYERVESIIKSKRMRCHDYRNTLFRFWFENNGFLLGVTPHIRNPNRTQPFNEDKSIRVLNEVSKTSSRFSVLNVKVLVRCSQLYL